MGLVQVIIDDSTDKTITGRYEFDRANGGTFIGGAGTSFPGTPATGEWFWRTDESKLYRYNGTSWDTVTAATAMHASTHENGGSDEVKLDDLGTPDDNTDLNSSTARHGLLPKLGGGTDNFLRADGSWAEPVFGQDYESAVSAAESSTTATSWQIKLSHTTAALTGTYRVAWTAVIHQSGVADAVQARLRNTTDSADVAGMAEHEPKDVRNRIHVGGFEEIIFSGAAKSFEMQFRQQRGGTAYISEARIEIWRVS
ncbi:MAG: hypothetical protein DRJ03_01800 [Chloroflexi bacterium]|nr:MAG: hypothetical protein DRJ03_01800 [Chloroflexota bacterium]